MLWTLRFCLCLLWMASVQSIFNPRDVSKNPDLDLSLKQPLETGVRNQGRHKTLFARRGLHQRRRAHLATPQVGPPPPKRRCSHTMESCLPRMQCCDPCAICHCRFFNTICYCWRLGPQCHTRS